MGKAMENVQVLKKKKKKKLIQKKVTFMVLRSRFKNNGAYFVVLFHLLATELQ